MPLVVDPIEARWAGFHVDVDRFDHSLVPLLEAHGVECLFSDNRYLDLLPAGVNKGSTLLALLKACATSAAITSGIDAAAAPSW